MPSEFEKLLRKGEKGRRFPRLPSLPRAFAIVPSVALLVFGFLLFDRMLTDDASSVQNAGGLPRVINGGNAWNQFDRERKATPKLTARAISGRVTHVRDGDTIEVRRVPIRIANLDCAEKGTVRGDAATRRMKQLVSNKALTCRLTGKRSYDRVVGTCSLENGRDIGQLMVSNGACGWWR